MPITFQEAVESGNFKFQKKIEKKIDTGNLVFLNLLFERGGRVFKPVFEGPPVYFPRGIKVEEKNSSWKWTGLCVFERSNEDCVNLVETEEHSSKVGFCKKSLLDVQMDIENTTASSKNGDLEIFKAADSDTVVFVLKEGDTVNVVGQKKIGKTEYLKVSTVGTRGLIQQIQDKQAAVLYEKQDEIKIRAESEEDMAKKFKHPTYYPRDKVTNEYDTTRDPSEFAQFIFYKDKDQENYAEITVMGAPDERLTPKFLENFAFRGIPFYDYSRVFIKASDNKIYSQIKIKAFIITELIKLEKHSILSNTVSRLNSQVSQEQQRKNMEILAAARKASPVEEEEEEEDNSAGSKEKATEEEDELDAIMNGTVSEDIDIELPDVPGL